MSNKPKTISYCVSLYETAYTDVIKICYHGVHEYKFFQSGVYIVGSDFEELIPYHSVGRIGVTEDE